MRFQDLGLLPELVSNAGYDAPTPVQSESIPAILNGRDVLAGAQTGTGKTAAFILPVMQKLYAGESKRSPRVSFSRPPGSWRHRLLTARVGMVKGLASSKRVSSAVSATVDNSRP